MPSSIPEDMRLPSDLWQPFGLPSPATVEGPFWGLSGAPAWKVAVAGRFWALKRLEPKQLDFAQRVATHKFLQKLQLNHLLPVPAPRGLETLGGWYWECCSWLPGQVLSFAGLRPQLGSKASALLGQVHRAAAQILPGSFGSCRQSIAFQGRVSVLEGPIGPWRSSEIRRLPPCLGEFVSTLHFDHWRNTGLELARRLRTWNQPVWLQTVHGDPHPTNWLWQGEAVTGLIDFLDRSREPRELDLARLWGDGLEGRDDLANWIESYESGGAGPPLQADLVRLLEASGVWVRLMNWVNILGGAHSTPGGETRVSQALMMRLEQLIKNARYWMGVFGGL